MNKKISKELLNSATIHYRFNHKMECIHFKDIVYIKSDIFILIFFWSKKV